MHGGTGSVASIGRAESRPWIRWCSWADDTPLGAFTREAAVVRAAVGAAACAVIAPPSSASTAVPAATAARLRRRRAEVFDMCVPWSEGFIEATALDLGGA